MTTLLDPLEIGIIRVVIGLALKSIIVSAVVSLAGCTPGLLIPASATASPSSLLLEARAWIAILDADDDMTVPPLPDDFKDEKTVALPDTGQVAPAPAPVVTVWTTGNCPPCENVKADIKGYTALDFQFKATGHPQWVRDRLNTGEGFPFIEWKSANPSGSYQHGWSGLAAFLRRYNASLKQAAADMATVAPSSPSTHPAAARHSSLLASAFNGAAGKWPGDLREHLNYSHGYTKESLAAMSDLACVSLHNQLHGGQAMDFLPSTGPERRAQKKSRPVRSLSYSLACPLGGCPQ